MVSWSLPKKEWEIWGWKKLFCSRCGVSKRWEVGENMNLEWFLPLWRHQLLILGAFLASGTVHYFFRKTLGCLNTSEWISQFYLHDQTFITSKDNPLSVPGVCVGCWSLGLKTAKVLKCFSGVHFRKPLGKFEWLKIKKKSGMFLCDKKVAS